MTDIAERHGALTPRYTIAPAQVVPTLLRPPPDSGRQFRLRHWGLIPSWAEDPGIGNRLINARAETVATQLAETCGRWPPVDAWPSGNSF